MEHKQASVFFTTRQAFLVFTGQQANGPTTFKFISVPFSNQAMLWENV